MLISGGFLDAASRRRLLREQSAQDFCVAREACLLAGRSDSNRVTGEIFCYVKDLVPKGTFLVLQVSTLLGRTEQGVFGVRFQGV